MAIEIIQFMLMVLIGIFLDPMNLLAYKFSDIYLTPISVYSGLIMAFNMMWGHEVAHYLSVGHCNVQFFVTGVAMVFIFTWLLRKQLLMNDEEYLKHMITHHSVAITTSQHISDNTKNNQIKEIADGIILTQNKEIDLMKDLISVKN